MRILLIEDDDEAAAFIAKGLRDAGHVVDHALDGETGHGMAAAGDYDAYVIDRMLPKMNGVDVLKRRRDEGDETPALFLSALGEVDDRVTGFQAGGDDYLVKPYAFSELLARVESLGKRRNAAPTAVTTRYAVADLEIDVLTRTVRRASQKIDLQPREFRLLEYLMRHAGQVVTRTMLLENVWEYHFDPQTNVIDVHISRLRSKIDKGFDRPLLKTIRGAGYTISDDD
ncbi:MAG: response regulator transcription factor [Pseudomonadota bacterium]